MSDFLPTGWKLLEIGYFCKLSYGKGLISKNLTKTGFPVYGANGIIGRFSEYMFEDSQLIISCRGSLSGVVHITEPKSYVTSNSIIIEPLISEIPKDFIKYALNFIDKSNIITGSAQPQITIQNLKNLQIPIPPIAEQIKIVKKLKDGLSLVNDYRYKVQHIPKILRKIRRKIINDAVNGRFSAEFRRTQENAKSGSRLIDELVELRKKENPKSKFSIDVNSIEVSSDFLIVPKEWGWTRLVNIAEVVSGVTKGRNLIGKDTLLLPYLRVANVQDGYLDLKEVKYIKALPADLEKYHLRIGDILFTEGGDRDKLGRGTIWKGEIRDCIHQNHIFRARVNDQFINPEYIGLFTKSDFARNYFYENASQTVNLASINLSALINIPIAIPPLEEQNYIAEQVGVLLVNISDIYSSYERLSKLLITMEKIILEKAFKGQLTTRPLEDNDTVTLIERARLQEKVNTTRNEVKSADHSLAKTIISISKSVKPKVQSIAKPRVSKPNKINKAMKIKPVETVSEMLERLHNLGGEAYPEALLLESSLEADIDLFFDFLREARDLKLIDVPVGKSGLIKVITRENS